jgi:hypothetical protein
MKASDLLGLDVVDRGGRHVGVVTDLRCVQDGPLRGSMAAPRVDALVVSGRHTGSMLGYDRREQQGPWLIRTIVRWLHRNLVVIPWSSVTDFDGRITLGVDAGELTGD